MAFIAQAVVVGVAWGKNMQGVRGLDNRFSEFSNDIRPKVDECLTRTAVIDSKITQINDKVAKQNGIKVTAEKLGLDWHIVRALVGAYCRKPKEPKPAENKTPRKPRIEEIAENVKPIEPDWQREAQMLRAEYEGYQKAVRDILSHKGL